EDYKTYTARFRGRVTSGSAEITVRKYLKSDSTVYSNATSKVVYLNGTWKTDSISFTVDPLYRYTVHVRNSASIGATSINIDFIEVYGEASASYLTCSEDSVGYRYGFNSMPKDNEIYGPEGSGYDFGARIYDSRLGRWLSVDPLAEQFPGWTPYNYTMNNPINLIDPDGREPIKPQAGTATGFVKTINTTGTKLGLKTGTAAHTAMLGLGKTEFSLKAGRPMPINTQRINTFSDKYIYTEKGGWIDMAHFMFYAGKAYGYKLQKQQAQEVVNSESFKYMRHGQATIIKQATMDPVGEA